MSVYKGFDPDLRQAVAIKVIRRELVDGPGGEQMRQRFKNEAIAGRRAAPPEHRPGVRVRWRTMTARTIVMAFSWRGGRSKRQYCCTRPSFRITMRSATGMGDEPGRDVQFVVQAPEPCPWKSRLGAGARLRFGGGRFRSIRNRVRMNRSRSRVYAELHHLQPERGARLEPGCVVVQMRQFNADAGAIG